MLPQAFAGAQAGAQSGGVQGAVIGGVAAFGKSVVEGVTNPLATASGNIRKFRDGLMSWEQPLKEFEGLFRSVGAYTNKFNPYYMDKFNLAVDNMQASIGEGLIPIVEFGTQMFNELGDAIASNSDVIKGVVKGSVELAGNVIDMGKRMAADLIPGYQELRSLMKFNEGSSANKAYRPAQISSVQSMISNLQTKAYGLGGGKSAEERTATATEKIAQLMEQAQQTGKVNIPGVGTFQFMDPIKRSNDIITGGGGGDWN